MKISHFRRDYLKSGLQRKDLDGDPINQFGDWLGQARDTDMVDPTAMTLATVNGQGQPSQRTVLLKYFDQNGFVFFTNYSSRKSQEIGDNPRVSLLFVWLELERQIQISGTARRISTADSVQYFLSRPQDSQVAAWVSHQSSIISSRSLLMQKFKEMKTKFSEGKVPLPSFWGGYRVTPHEFEFWQGGKDRLHDRFRYRPDDNGWMIERLAP